MFLIGNINNYVFLFFMLFFFFKFSFRNFLQTSYLRAIFLFFRVKSFLFFKLNLNENPLIIWSLSHIEKKLIIKNYHVIDYKIKY